MVLIASQTPHIGLTGPQLHLLVSITNQGGFHGLQHVLSVYLDCDNSKLCNLPILGV